MAVSLDLARLHALDTWRDPTTTTLRAMRPDELNAVRAQVDFLRHHVPAGARVLEVGASCGNYTRPLAWLGGRVVVGDISEGQLRQHARRLERTTVESWIEDRIVLDVVDLPFADGSFDAVVCIGGVLSYVFDQAPRGMRELARVTRPGGVVVASVCSHGAIDTWCDEIVRQGCMDREDVASMRDRHEIRHAGLPLRFHQLKGWTWRGLDHLAREASTVIVDRAAIPWTRHGSRPYREFFQICRSRQEMAATNGYLLIAARRPPIGTAVGEMPGPAADAVERMIFADPPARLCGATA